MKCILFLLVLLFGLSAIAQDCNSLVVNNNGDKYGKELQLFYPMTTDQGEMVYTIMLVKVDGILYVSGDDYRWKRNHPNEIKPTGKGRYYVFKFSDNTEHVYRASKVACKNKDFCVQLTGKSGDKKLLKKMIKETLSDIRVYEHAWTKNEHHPPVRAVVFIPGDAAIFKQILKCMTSKQ